LTFPLKKEYFFSGQIE